MSASFLLVVVKLFDLKYLKITLLKQPEYYLHDKTCAYIFLLSFQASLMQYHGRYSAKKRELACRLYTSPAQGRREGMLGGKLPRAPRCWGPLFCVLNISAQRTKYLFFWAKYRNLAWKIEIKWLEIKAIATYSSGNFFYLKCSK
jgi:hypothetical protein